MNKQASSSSAAAPARGGMWHTRCDSRAAAEHPLINTPPPSSVYGQLTRVLRDAVHKCFSSVQQKYAPLTVLSLAKPRDTFFLAPNFIIESPKKKKPGVLSHIAKFGRKLIKIH